MRPPLPGISWKAVGALALVTAFLAAITFYALLSTRKDREDEISPEGRIHALFGTYYSSCGCLVWEERDLHDEDMAVLTGPGGTGWQLVAVREGVSWFFRSVAAYCPDHSRLRLITLKDGVVRVYRGRDDNERFLVTTYPDLREELMTPDTRSDLASGILVEDEPDSVDDLVERYLEGIID